MWREVVFDGWASKYSVSINKAKIGNVSISKVKAARKKKVNVTFTTANGVVGYQIRYSTDKNFEKNVKIKTFNLNKAKIVNGNKRAYTISKLKKNKKYYFQIRAYVDRDNSRYYSDWSKAKKVKVK
ncbi:fibronectin type III domain-containing protein [Butyrivibrio sp. JL13D10]|uniref:fibronectin type III domain-containing protein n=1 Tax=Butyrivibrio sp. JL13D10 TaxID=3236815 RepID=UPI0038B4C659